MLAYKSWCRYISLFLLGRYRGMELPGQVLIASFFPNSLKKSNRKFFFLFQRIFDTARKQNFHETANIIFFKKG